MGKNKKMLREALIEYLDCPCRIFKPEEDDSVLMEAYKEAAERGKQEGFTPVLVCYDNIETMLETLLENAGQKQQDSRDYSFDIEAVRAFRQDMCKKKLPEGKAVLEEWIKNYAEYFEEYEDEEYDYEEDYEDEEYDYEEDYEDEEYGCEEDYEDEDEESIIFSACRSSSTVLAKIPTAHPWEIFAWLPFGGWNECPDTEALMAVSKYWFEAYGAVPAAVSHDVLEYLAPEPVEKQDARILAREMIAFCPDIIEQGEAEPGELAESLTESAIWFFWWD